MKQTRASRREKEVNVSMYEIFLGNRLFGTTETKKEVNVKSEKNLQIKRRILLKTSSPTKQNYLKKVNKDLMRLSQLEIICPQRINPKTQVLISK